MLKIITALLLLLISLNANEIKTFKDKELAKNSYPQKDLDCITISDWLLFGGNYAMTKEALLRSTFYNRITKSLSKSVGYLQGVERVQMDSNSTIKEFNKRLNLHRYL